MSPLEAKKIINALANGIDPETGEILSGQSTLNNPQVIRALFVAEQALDDFKVKRARRERDPTLPDNAGQKWSDAEDDRLLGAFDAGILVEQIAEKHGRTPGSIASRLVRLGRIDDAKEFYAGAKAVRG